MEKKKHVMPCLFFDITCFVPPHTYTVIWKWTLFASEKRSATFFIGKIVCVTLMSLHWYHTKIYKRNDERNHTTIKPIEKSEKTLQKPLFLSLSLSCSFALAFSHYFYRNTLVVVVHIWLCRAWNIFTRILTMQIAMNWME